MKIFGKRSKSSTLKKSSPEDDRNETGRLQVDEEKDVAVPSYFSSNFRPPSSISRKNDEKSVGEKNDSGGSNNVDIEALLSMDYSTLNAKQRRLIRRHNERTGKTEKHTGNINADEKAKDGTNIVTGTDPLPSLPTTAAGTRNDVKDENQCVDEDIIVDLKNQSKESKLKTQSSKNVRETISKSRTSKDDDDDGNRDTIDNSHSKDRTKISKEKDESHSANNSDAIQNANASTKANIVTSSSSSASVVDQLKGLNSKERRKLLRKLAMESKLSIKIDSKDQKQKQEMKIPVLTTTSPLSIDVSHYSSKSSSSLLAVAEEEAKRIAQQNRETEKQMRDKLRLEKQVQQQKQQQKEKIEKEQQIKRKRDDEVGDNVSNSTNTQDASSPSSSSKEKGNNSENEHQPLSKKKKKWKDFSHLPPVERERREKQRQMQQEAIKRRLAGEEDLTRHALNSERRRANRRKPGRAGKIALLVKESKERRRRDGVNSFNAGGYHIRREKISNTSKNGSYEGG